MSMFVQLPFDTSAMVKKMDQDFLAMCKGSCGRHHHVQQRRCPHQVALKQHPLANMLKSMKSQTVQNGKPDSFEVNVPVKGYKPEEVHVELKQDARVLKITGKHQEKNADGKVIGVMQFSRSYTIPESCNMDEIKSSLTQEGVLKILAPCTKEAIEDQKGSVEDKNTSDNAAEATEAPADNPSSEAPQEKKEDMFSVEVDASGYEPEDLNLEVNSDGLITLSAKHEEKSEHGTSVIQFSKSFTVPQNTDLSGLKSQLSKDKILTITAPKKQEALKQEKINIPIAMGLA